MRQDSTGGDDFNPRAPCGARRSRREIQAMILHFNPRAPCGARRALRQQREMTQAISIHAPRVGRDDLDDAKDNAAEDFNPRAPCGARPSVKIALCWPSVFQSTRPVWGATFPPETQRLSHINFNPRAPCGARPIVGRRYAGHTSYFNPRAPCGARPPSVGPLNRLFIFQSTRPVWGATANLTILPRQICTKGTKEFLLGRKTHGKKEK